MTIMLGAVLAGVAVGWLSLEILSIAGRELVTEAQAWDFETRRLIRLRDGSPLFRWFQPLIDEIKDLRALQRIGQVNKIAASLRQGGSELPWTAAEFAGVSALEGLIVGFLVGFTASGYVGFVGAAAIALLSAALYLQFAAVRLRKQAARRLTRFKQRLPFAIDLMALMMEAGGDFRQCLGTVVRENQAHPVGEEFGRLLQTVSAGQPLREALDQLRERMCDEDVNEIVFSVKNAEELGTPLSHTFLTLAEQMRLKRSQRYEKLVGEAQPMMNFPGMVIMIACLLITVAPFVLAAINNPPF